MMATTLRISSLKQSWRWQQTRRNQPVKRRKASSQCATERSDVLGLHLRKSSAGKRYRGADGTMPASVPPCNRSYNRWNLLT